MFLHSGKVNYSGMCLLCTCKRSRQTGITKQEVKIYYQAFIYISTLVFTSEGKSQVD